MPKKLGGGGRQESIIEVNNLSVTVFDLYMNKDMGSNTHSVASIAGTDVHSCSKNHIEIMLLR